MEEQTLVEKNLEIREDEDMEGKAI